MSAQIDDVIQKAKIVSSLPDPRRRAAIRKRCGLTQNDMARALGINRVALSRYETGERRADGEILKNYVDLLRRLDRITVRKVKR